MSEAFRLRRDTRVNGLIGAGHFLSHFYSLCLPPVFLAWQSAFHVSFAELGLSVALMSAASALAQIPVGILVDRYGARPFLVGGSLVMGLSVTAMGLATAFWQIVLFAMLSGVGNSVFHPADYAILSGSIGRERLGRAFAFHTFVGYVGFAAAPPVTAALVLLFGWREALVLLGLVGVPIVAMILWQSAILVEEAHEPKAREGKSAGGVRLLLTRPILFHCAFFMVSAMATAGIQSWLITILHKAHGMTLAAASSALTGYLVGSLFGVLAGGWTADRTTQHFAHVAVLTSLSAALFFFVGVAPLAVAATVGAMAAGGLLLGASRTPRDMMVKRDAPPGEVGKVFGFVSAGLSLGAAVMPVPYGMLIDAQHPRLVLVTVAALLLLSIAFATGSRVAPRRDAAAVPAE